MNANAENTSEKQVRRGGFSKGRSGNPVGRPKGARNRATLAMEALFDDEAGAIGRRAIELAKDGDTTALRLVVERILPPRRSRPVAFRLPTLNSAADAAKATAAIVAAVASGALTPDEAESLGRLVGSYVKALEASDFEARLAALEADRGVEAGR